MRISLPTYPELSLAVRPIRESSEELLNLLERKDLYLPSLQKISTENRKREWLAVRVLLRDMLQEEKQIGYLSSGRPYLVDGTFQISISHTKGYVAAGLHPQLPIGIDIEYLSSRVRKIRSRFLTDDEDKNISGEYEDAHLLLHWSAKEALFKVLREEEVDFRQHLHVNPFTPVFGGTSSFSAVETKTPQQHAFVIDYTLNQDFLATATAWREAT